VDVRRRTMSEPKKYYTVSFIPFDTLQYDYFVEAKDENEAYTKGKQELIEAIGYDASKDWECSDIEEASDENI
jgi:hypothetical protein